MIRVRVTADPKLARSMKKLQDPALVETMLENALVAGALQIANAAKDTYDFLGSPEGELALAQAFSRL